MTEIEIQEAFEAVTRLNDEIGKKYGWESAPIISFTRANKYTLINISIGSFELPLFNCQIDDRLYDDQQNKYEPFYGYIKRKFEQVKKEICEIKL